MALGMAWGAVWQALRPGHAQHTYWWYRVEILAALGNGLTLLAIAAVVVWQAISRIGSDPDVASGALLGFALVGLAANLVAALILHSPHAQSLNVRGAYYHVLCDAMGSVAALVAGVVILATGWTTIDIIASLVIAVVFAVVASRLLWETAEALLEAAHSHLGVEDVERTIRGTDGVLGIHDLHLWTVSSGFPALSCHLEVDETTPAESILVTVTQRLREKFGLQHITIQQETTMLYAAMECYEFPDVDDVTEVRRRTHRSVEGVQARDRLG